MRRFSQPGLAEEAASYVLEKLSQDDWSACRQYSGRAKPETYLLTLTNHILEEFARKRFGRPRPPEWLKREGEFWVRVWRMVCLERQAVPAVIDQLSAAGRSSTEFVQRVITTIKARLPWCGTSAREITEDCFYAKDDDLELFDNSLEEALTNQQLEDALLLVYQLLLSESGPSKSDKALAVQTSIHDARWEACWTALREQLSLSPEERLLLKMVYQEGFKLKVVAASLNMPPYQPGRLLNNLLLRIRQTMEEAGIELENLDLEVYTDGRSQLVTK